MLPIDSRYDKANSWHTDVTFVDRVPSVSAAGAFRCRSYGGTTTWASTEAAYEQLPRAAACARPRTCGRCTPISYDYAADYDGRHGDTDRHGARVPRRSSRTEYYETEHPVVRVHPKPAARAAARPLHQTVRRAGPSRVARRCSVCCRREITKLENTIRWNWQSRRSGDLGQPRHPALRRRGLRRPVPAAQPRHAGRRHPVDVHGQHSRAVVTVTPHCIRTWSSPIRWRADRRQSLSISRDISAFSR